MYEVIHAEQANFPVSVMCETLEVSRSGYYAWATRKDAAPTEKAIAHKKLDTEVQAIFTASRKTYGRPRIHAKLMAKGRRVGANRLRKTMLRLGIRAKIRKRYKRTTDSNHDHPIAPNLLNQDFSANAPNQVWCSDITYVRTTAGWLYLAVIIDLFARKVVGYALEDHMRTELTLAALEMALSRRNVSDGLIHHSDRGSQYAAGAYRKALKARGIVQSMSRAADCYDNSVVESFNDKIKQELLHRGAVKSPPRTHDSIVDYIEMFYNSERIHSTLGYLYPNDFESQRAASKKAA